MITKYLLIPFFFILCLSHFFIVVNLVLISNLFAYIYLKLNSTLADISNIIFLYLSYFSLDKPSTGSILKIAWSADGTQVNKYIKDRITQLLDPKS